MTEQQRWRRMSWERTKWNLEHKIYESKVHAWVQLGLCVIISYLAFTVTILCLPQAIMHWVACWSYIQMMRDNISLLVREEMLGFDREVYDY